MTSISANPAAQSSPAAAASTLATSLNLSPATALAASLPGTHQYPCLSVRDILAHKSTMFNYKLPSDRTMYESSLIYCNLCDFSCDLTDKSAIICHYLAKHPDDNIVYSYLWPQMEQNPVTNTYKVKYYLIKAHLKIRTKEPQDQDPGQINLDAIQFPGSLLATGDEEAMDVTESAEGMDTSTVDAVETQPADVGLIMGRMLDWCEKNLVVQTSATGQNVQPDQSGQETVQELEEEQEGWYSRLITY